MSLDTASGVATQSSITQSHNHTIRYVINGANQIQCIDADASGACGGSEVVWEYDAYGGVLDDGSTQYTYDAANRLASITTASGTTTYGYNGDNDRISQSVNGTLTTYVLDTATPLTMVLAETNTSTGETTQYWHALDTLAQSDGTTTEYFAYDGLGSVRQLVDETGSVGLAQTFDAYGNGYAKAGSAQSALGYTGEQTDSNGFVFLRARYYNPSAGRFFQRDTWGGDNQRPQSLNVYMYVEGRVIVLVDPSGMSPVSPPTQPDGDVTKPPVYMDRDPHTAPYWDPPTVSKELEFEPNVDFQPAKLFMGSMVSQAETHIGSDWNIPDTQFHIPGYEGISRYFRGYLTFCGPMSVVAIMQNLLGNSSPGLIAALDILIKHDTDPDDEGLMTEAEAKDYQGMSDLMNFIDALGGLGYRYRKYPSSSTINAAHDRYYSEVMRRSLDGRRWPIVLVGDKSILHPNKYKLVPLDFCYAYDKQGKCLGNGHFVVITGLSKKEYWDRDKRLACDDENRWAWIRIYNSLSNTTEYYRGSDFSAYQNSSKYVRETLWVFGK